MTSTSAPVIVVLGVGPGLGMSVAQRFGKEGYAVALISRSADRHPDYLQALETAGVDAAAFTADANDPAQLRHAVDAVRKHFGRIDIGYFGPAATMSLAGDITTLTAAEAESAFKGVVPAVDFASLLLPELTERGEGALLFAGGLSSVVPMPPLGALALAAAALRNYAITLHAALAPAGIYAGTITIGGAIDRSDIHTAMRNDPGFAELDVATLDPDDLAETVWRLYSERTDAEAVITG
jgi:NAD(P)-dependent dehydrogenase (short-subunit alcohol dehydrogenase family)